MSLMRPRVLLPGLLALLLAASPFSGCGGTSVDTGNPGLDVTFRKDGEAYAFDGLLQIYAHDANPLFHLPGEPPGGDADARSRNVRILCCGSDRHFLDRATLEAGAGHRISLPLLPSYYDDREEEAAFGAVPGDRGLKPGRAFNLAFHDGESDAYAFVPGIRVDAQGNLVDSVGNRLETLAVDLLPAGEYVGTLDTAGLDGEPLAVYAPGSHYFARVHGDRFLLRNVPLAPLAIRLVTSTGAVHGFDAPLRITRRKGDPVPDAQPPLVPGPRLDSVHLPEPLETLAPPKAFPAGPHDFTDSLAVTLSAAPGAVIYYTTSDTALPGKYSRPYTGPIVLRATTSLRAVAYREGAYRSAVSINEFYRVPQAPRAEPPSRAFRDSLRVVLSTPARGGSIHYTLDGSMPTDASPRYTGPLVLDSTTTVKAITVVGGIRPSHLLQEIYLRVDSLTSYP